MTQAAGSRDVVANNANYNGNVGPNASVTFGFQGTHGGANSSPATFTVNGTVCN